MSDEPTEILTDMIEDPETEAYLFSGVGPDGSVVTFGGSRVESPEPLRQIVASALVQYTTAVDADEETAIRYVVDEYNGRKKEAVTEGFGGGLGD